MELSKDIAGESYLSSPPVVIIVEDDEGLNHLLQRNLQREGYQTEGLLNGGDAVVRVLRDPNVILVLDYKLPDMSGKDVVGLLSGRGLKVPFIIVTGHGDERIAVEMMKMGARDYIIKDSGLMDVIPHVLKRVVDELVKEEKLSEAERSLQKSEERYRRITSAITDYIYTVRIESGRPVSTKHGEACFAVTGYTADEFAADEYLWIRIVVEEDHDIIRKQVEHVLAGLSPPPVEHRIIRKDGSLRWVESAVVPSFDTHGNLVSYDGIIRDISERKEAERALRISEEKFSKAFRSGPTFISISTLNEGRYIDVNDAYLKAGGYTREEVIGRTEAELGCWINPDDRARMVRMLWEKGIVNNEEVSFRIRPGVILDVLWSAETIDVKGETCIIAIILDITEHKTLERQLLQSQKMEAVGQLAGGVAHDFNNILTAIISYGYLLKKKITEGDPINEHMDKILVLANRASNITQGLLTFSRKRYLDLSPVKLNEIISSSENLLSKFLGEDILIRTKITPKDPVITADRTQIEQVIVNLATNARDAMPGGGTLTIETELVMLDDDFIKYHGFGKPGMYAYLSVEDTGLGMSEETRQKIFEPFFTTKDVGKGTGLGLAITYGIIKQHLGYINIYSEPGKGTIFKIYLPAVMMPVSSGRGGKPQLPAGKSETILIAEDDETVRDSIRKMLEEFGYKVIGAVSGEDAIAKFMMNRDRIKLVILDVIMPGMNGRDTLERIREINPHMNAIFTSGYTAEFLKQKKIFGDDGVILTKPIVPEQFLSKIREMLDRREDNKTSANSGERMM